MKPFALLAAREDDAAVQGEYRAVRRFMGLEPEQLVLVRLEQGPLPPLDFSDYSGLIIGGSPYNVSDDETAKSGTQKRVESDLSRILAQSIAEDFPVLGLCYGLGLLTQLLGGIVNREYGEEASAVEVRLTTAGQADPLLAGFPTTFPALTGHKEAVAELPSTDFQNGMRPGLLRALGFSDPTVAHISESSDYSAVQVLATGAACPVQMVRVGRNAYATQFHPELDEAGIKERLAIYLDKGYCAPDEYDAVIERITGTPLTNAQQILKNFAILYGHSG